ncbi:enoyl-CoA hydratase [Candidatus Bathyarchaeota archaeon]|nr:MAG: enoyl-CoA hydratase [Candidatus Bathyarchaeota archaeon]TMI30634.1 MAG: enoyl-CoA hydratase [Candidatus Bathyarchaeota archaeon]
MPYEHILVETEPPVGIIRLNRPKVLNALSFDVLREIVDALEKFDKDETIKATLLTGSDEAFSAGADIKELSEATPVGLIERNQFALWDRLKRTAKPIVGAVSGYAYGGGCELAMNCDIIIASETAKFGQPEINIGIMPGAGGTQRLTRTIGKFRSMEMILTGQPITAREAEKHGLVNKVVPVEAYLQEAKKLAMQISQKAPVAVRLAKEAVLKAFDTPLEEGLQYERRNFYLLFSTEDMKEGMKAFTEKRPPHFKGR